jgi:hypothetical protein
VSVRHFFVKENVINYGSHPDIVFFCHQVVATKTLQVRHKHSCVAGSKLQHLWPLSKNTKFISVNTDKEQCGSYTLSEGSVLGLKSFSLWGWLSDSSSVKTKIVSGVGGIILTGENQI